MDARVAPLHAALDALDIAVAHAPGEDHAQQLADYDAQLRQAVDTHGDTLSRSALDGLLQHQQRLSARMRALRDEAASQLQQGQRGLRAAHAYLKAGSLA